MIDLPVRLPFLKQAVLLLCDDALSIYVVSPKAVSVVDRISWEEDDFENAVISVLQKECKGLPLILMNDMTDQQYKGGQRVPAVGPLDKASVVKRKLYVAFPNALMRGALPMQDPGKKKGLSDFIQITRGNDDIENEKYLFAGVSSSEPVLKTIEIAKKSLLQIAGFFLLPVEASDVVNRLAKELSGKKQGGSKWVVFMGQHHSGALRQIIIRDGQLAMTRMTPISNLEQDMSRWIDDVSNEFTATMSYLSRFGFSPEDGLDVIVVSTKEAGDLLAEQIDIPCDYYSLDVAEAADFLNLKVGKHSEKHHADLLHIAAACKKPKFSMQMESSILTRIQRMRQAAAAGLMFLIVAAMYFLFEMGTQGLSYLDQKEIMAFEQQRYDASITSLAEAQQKLKEQGVDIKFMQASVNTYNMLEEGTEDILPVLQKLMQASGDTIKFDSFELKLDEQKPNVKRDGILGALKPALRNQLKANFLQGHISLYLASAEVAGQRPEDELNNLLRNLREALPQYKVDFKKERKRNEYEAVASGTLGDVEDSVEEENLEASENEKIEIVLIGPFDEGNTGN